MQQIVFLQCSMKMRYSSNRRNSNTDGVTTPLVPPVTKARCSFGLLIRFNRLLYNVVNYRSTSNVPHKSATEGRKAYFETSAITDEIV
jgi:hypothetical protein